MTPLLRQAHTNGEIKQDHATTLCATVRLVALRAHRLLGGVEDSANGNCEAEDLHRQVAGLEEQLGTAPNSDLTRWVKALRQQLEDRLANEPGAA